MMPVKTYRVLKEIMYALSDAQINTIEKWLREMDDNEFREVPTILMTPDQQRLIETYGTIIGIMRNGVDHRIYCIFPAIFKIIN